MVGKGLRIWDRPAERRGDVTARCDTLQAAASMLPRSSRAARAIEGVSFEKLQTRVSKKFVKKIILEISFTRPKKVAEQKPRSYERPESRVFYIFIFFKIVFYKNIFSFSQFTGFYIGVGRLPSPAGQ